ncbi:MAG: MMPL family transporter, partial [Dehalococcoidia bacterium]
MASSDGRKLTATARVAQWSARHRWWVLGATVLTLVAAIYASATIEPQILDGDGDIGESQRAFDVLREKFPRGSEASEQLLLSHGGISVTDPAFQEVAEALFADLEALPQVKSVGSYYVSDDATLVSEDGHVLRAGVTVDREVHTDRHRADAILETVAEARESYRDDGYTIAIVGNLTTSREVNNLVEEDFGRIMFISLGLGLVILLLAFRAVVAAVVPLLLAVGAITIATGLAAIISQGYALADAYTEMILLLGLAVGIDYSLFIVSRFRNEREAGREKYDAITTASNTTGRAVFFAGITVLVSLAGLTLTEHPIFVSLAIGAMLVVFVATIGSLTFLPAVLAVLGDGVNRLGIPFLNRAGGNGFWGAITDRVMAKPVVFASITLAALLALSVPALSLNIGFPTGSKALHEAASAKQALRLLEDHFTAGFTDPALVVVSGTDVTTPEMQAAVERLKTRLEAEPDSYFGPFETVVNPDGDALFVRVPMSDDTSIVEGDLDALRDEIIPEAFQTTGASVLVGGFAASNMDFRRFVFDKAPLIFAFVLGVAFLLLLVMFRSIVIPIKSILLNLLSVGAAYGVLVMVFQWGWGVQYLGSES